MARGWGRMSCPGGRGACSRGLLTWSAALLPSGSARKPVTSAPGSPALRQIALALIVVSFFLKKHQATVTAWRSVRFPICSTGLLRPGNTLLRVPPTGDAWPSVPHTAGSASPRAAPPGSPPSLALALALGSALVPGLHPSDLSPACRSLKMGVSWELFGASQGRLLAPGIGSRPRKALDFKASQHPSFPAVVAFPSPSLPAPQERNLCLHGGHGCDLPTP